MIHAINEKFSTNLSTCKKSCLVKAYIVAKAMVHTVAEHGKATKGHRPPSRKASEHSHANNRSDGICLRHFHIFATLPFFYKIIAN